MDKIKVIRKTASCFVIKDGKILLIYHKKFGKYLQPGGHIDEAEEPWQTAIREVLEETGVVIEIDDKKPFNTEVYNTKIGPQYDYQFIGRVVQENNLHNNEESYLCGWFDIDNLNQYDVANDIPDKIAMVLKLIK